jgi:hypothetical protein
MPEDKKVRITGIVIKKLSSPGSKSERAAYYVQSGGKQYQLRKRNENPWNPSTDFGVYEGKQVSFVGTIDDYTLFVDELPTK